MLTHNLSAKSRNIKENFFKIREIIQKLKLDERYKILINNSEKNIGFLRPITFNDIRDDSLIKRLVIWRNENIKAYLNRELTDFERTRRWLKKFVLDNKTKILFLICNSDSTPIGHVGLADGLNTDLFFEIDNVIRGVKSKNSGLMTLALYELISWIFNMYGGSKVYLRVFSNNNSAIEFYKKLKFSKKQKFALEKSINNDVISYSINETLPLGKVYFISMELSRQKHFNNFNLIKRL